MLVILGATPEGSDAEKKTPGGGVFLPNELVGFQIGVRESAQSWRELLVDIKARGLKVPPEIAVGDGAMRFWKALDEVFPGRLSPPSKACSPPSGTGPCGPRGRCRKKQRS